MTTEVRVGDVVVCKMEQGNFTGTVSSIDPAPHLFPYWIEVFFEKNSQGIAAAERVPNYNMFLKKKTKRRRAVRQVKYNPKPSASRKMPFSVGQMKKELAKCFEQAARRARVRMDKLSEKIAESASDDFPYGNPRLPEVRAVQLAHARARRAMQQLEKSADAAKQSMPRRR